MPICSMKETGARSREVVAKVMFTWCRGGVQSRGSCLGMKAEQAHAW